MPSLLVVGVRNHLLHDGSLYDLDERFHVDWENGYITPDQHGFVSGLTEDEIEALNAYLRTL